MLDWDNLRVFLAAVRAGNYSTAARHLRIDRTTVGRKLERLEHQMGVTLFEQGDDGYHPTPAGKRALEIADEIERLIQDLTDEVNPRSGPGPSTVRLSVAAELDCEFVPELARFSSVHPDIQIAVQCSASPADDVIARRCDLALCLADSKPDHMRGRLIGQLYQAGYAAPGYLEKRGTGLPPQWLTHKEAV